MPRISDNITLNTVQYNAVRPQNGDTPAMLREHNTGKAFAALSMINMGADVVSQQNRVANRATASLVFPVVGTAGSELGQRITTNRIDFKSRIDASATETEVADIIQRLRDFVATPEFAALIRGEQQY